MDLPGARAVAPAVCGSAGGSGGMKIVEIRREPEFEQLRESWSGLLNESAAPNIFLSWEWAFAWWSAYGTPGELRIFTFFDDRNVLRGIAPFRRRKIRKYGQTVET